MRKFFYENGLSIVLLGLFFTTFIGGQTIAGYWEYNSEQREHGKPGIAMVEYLGTAHFLEATSENWESEFLQMFVFVALTTVLFQKGSAESKDPYEKPQPEPESRKADPRAPWPVRRGGVVLKVYENSLSLAFLLLFLVAFVLHAASGARNYNEEQAAHGVTEQLGTLEYMGSSRFWFESFQNWQSEFLAVGLMVILSIWLRQKGSPESKAVESAHDETGK